MLASLLSLMACTQDAELNVIYPELVTSSEQLEFGDVAVREDSVLPIEIINAGRAPLELVEIGLLEGSVFSVEGEIPSELGQDERVMLDLRFTPDTFLEYSDLLQIQTNDPDFEPSLDIPLTGEGVDAPEPDILVEPLSLDFGDVPLGTVGTLWFGS